jgi:hypothetical protein
LWAGVLPVWYATLYTRFAQAQEEALKKLTLYSVVVVVVAFIHLMGGLFGQDSGFGV